MNGIIYYTKIKDEYDNKNMEHMIGEKLLEIGLEKEFGRKLAFEPRAKGEHGKPFFTLLPRIHYHPFRKICDVPVCRRRSGH